MRFLVGDLMNISRMIPILKDLETFSPSRDLKHLWVMRIVTGSLENCAGISGMVEEMMPNDELIYGPSG